MRLPRPVIAAHGLACRQKQASALHGDIFFAAAHK